MCEQYHRLNDELGELGAWTEENQAQKDALIVKMGIIREQMFKQNLSFIPKVEITPEDLTDEKKIIDKVVEITSSMIHNEVSALEGLEWLEKNGEYAKDIDFGKHYPMGDAGR